MILTYCLMRLRQSRSLATGTVCLRSPLARACARAQVGEDQWWVKTTGLDRVPVEPFTAARVRISL